METPIASIVQGVIENQGSNLPTDAEREKQEQAKAASENMRRAEKLATEAGGKRYAGYRFGNWNAVTDRQKVVKAAMQEWAETFPERLKNREGVILWGPVGTGKDHLLFSAARQAVIQHGATVKWKNGRDLMGEMRDRISEDRSERELIAGIEAPQVLVISDPLPVIGDLTPYQADMLYRIVENRYACGSITAVTLNISSDEEADKRIGTPTWDRLCHNAWKIQCEWATARKPARIV